MSVRAKTLIAALLALFVGSCACLMPMAAAAATEQDHSCCPSPAKTADQGSDCCLRAAPPPSSAALFVPELHVVGLLSAPLRVIAVEQSALWLDSAALSPPSAVFVPSRSSRAPPSLLA